MSLPSGTNWCLHRTVGQASRILVLSLVLGAATQASAGPPSEQAKPRRATCFLNEIRHPQADKIAKATVFIAAVARDGTLASEGTGFVVSDSADGGTQGSRIVTARLEGVLRAGGTAHPREVRRRGRISRRRLGRGARCEKAMSAR